MLLPGAEHDQLAVVIPGGAEQQPGDPSSAVAVGDARNDHDSSHAACVENSLLDGLPPGDDGRCLERRLLVDGEVVSVDPLTADMQVGLAAAVERLDRR